jgi:hypothetical protein
MRFMIGLEALPASSRITLYVILALIGFLTLIVGWAQAGCIRGRPFQNPDGTADDWREQKIFYGMAWADLVVACPLSLIGLAMVFTAPRLGFFLLGGVSVWFLWANVMTTVTSLRFEKPRITLQWLVVFPFGFFVGLAYLAWILIHFETVFG